MTSDPIAVGDRIGLVLLTIAFVAGLAREVRMWRATQRAHRADLDAAAARRVLAAQGRPGYSNQTLPPGTKSTPTD